MIMSTLKGTNDFSAYPAAFRKALAYLAETDFLSLPLGKYEVDGDRIFVKLMDMTTKPYEGSHPEIHKKYIDIFYWPEGGEKIGWAPYLGTETVVESHPEKDISFLEDVANEKLLSFRAGEFCVFFPWDAHRPGLILEDAPATTRKVVVKVSLEALKA